MTESGAGEYRYGFNGKEVDEEGEWGSSTVYDYGFRIYNPAIARFLSVDPLTKSYPMLTPYQFASNTPIWAIDLDGLEADHINDGVMSDAPERQWEPVLLVPNFSESLRQQTWDLGNNLILKPLAWLTQLGDYHVADNAERLGNHDYAEELRAGADDAVFNLAVDYVTGKVIGKALNGLLSIRIKTGLNQTGQKGGVVVRSSAAGSDVRAATVVREIKRGRNADGKSTESLNSLIEEAKLISYRDGVEAAVIQLKSGDRLLVTGGKHGIELPRDTDILFGHTHPNLRGGNNGPSIGDRDAILPENLNQSKTYIFHEGQRTTIYQGTNSSSDVSTSEY